MSDATICLPKGEYDMLRTKADLFDKFIETEELTNTELNQVKKALKGPFMTKSEFLTKHSELA